MPKSLVIHIRMQKCFRLCQLTPNRPKSAIHKRYIFLQGKSSCRFLENGYEKSDLGHDLPHGHIYIVITKVLIFGGLTGSSSGQVIKKIITPKIFL